MKNVLISISTALLIILFTYAAFSKLLDYHTFFRSLSGSPITKPIAPLLFIFLPLSEIVISALLIFEKSRIVGLFASLVLLLTFTLYITYILTLAEHVPCSCGGVISGMTWKNHLLFNAFFIIINLLAIILSKIKLKKSSVLKLA